MAITLNKHHLNDTAGPINGITNVLGNPATGDLITAEFTVDDSTGSIVSGITINDNGNAGNYSFAIGPTYVSAIQQWVGIAYMPNSTNASITISFSWTGGARGFVSLAAQSWSGAPTSNPLLTGMVQQQFGQAANPTSGSVLTPATNGALVLGVGIFGNNTPTAGSNYLLTDSSSITLLFPEYWIQTTATATNTPFTAATDSAGWQDQMVAFGTQPIVGLTYEDDSYQQFQPPPVDPQIGVW